MAGADRRWQDQTGDDMNRQKMARLDRIWQNQTEDGQDWTGDVRTRKDQSEGLTEPDRRWQNQKNKIEELADQTGEIIRQI
jgi:hypothetical protein